MIAENKSAKSLNNEKTNNGNLEKNPETLEVQVSVMLRKKENVNHSVNLKH